MTAERKVFTFGYSHLIRETDSIEFEADSYDEAAEIFFERTLYLDEVMIIGWSERPFVDPNQMTFPAIESDK